MHSPVTIRSLFYASATVVSFAAAFPLCNNTAAAAEGSLSNISKLLSISTSAVKSFQLAMFFENLKVYSNDTIEVVTSVAAQKEVYVATIIDILENYNAAFIFSCNYFFPVNSTKEFFEIANTITSVGIGATIGLAKSLAITNLLLIQSVLSILTVEARYNAFFRLLNGKAFNPAFFDTGISDIWAYNLAFSFIVPGSCFVEIPLLILSALNVSDPIVANFTQSSFREFKWDPAQIAFVTEASKQLVVGWVN
ncbi:hypothetical protein B0O99DRAFT_656749 [Bisporella sp. PMI_857]|nr:hypothetical protein B0O99DRAFT_656749 [Bisporella sp. PMI_857]